VFAKQKAKPVGLERCRRRSRPRKVDPLSVGSCFPDRCPRCALALARFPNSDRTRPRSIKVRPSQDQRIAFLGHLRDHTDFALCRRRGQFDNIAIGFNDSDQWWTP